MISLLARMIKINYMLSELISSTFYRERIFSSVRKGMYRNDGFAILRNMTKYKQCKFRKDVIRIKYYCDLIMLYKYEF